MPLLNDSLDTIAAIATPIGVGSIGIIRLSGPEALSIIRLLCTSIPETPQPRYLYYGLLKHPKTKALLDEVCLCYFKAPQSFTGEDIVEIHGHSNPVLLHRILSLLLSLGARLADKGEFSKRAFLLGKMDLPKAESLMDLMSSPSPATQHVALSQVKGKLYHLIQSYRQSMISFLEVIEGSIDFPDEVPSLDHTLFKASLQDTENELSRLIRMHDFGRVLFSGVKCLFLGKPNVGKSTLFNAILGEDRSIVTSEPGTTRDVIDASISIGNVLFTFMDAAGLRDTSQPVERLGIQRLKPLVDDAYVVLWVMDASIPVSQEDKVAYELLKEHSRVYVIQNKSDLPKKLEMTDLALEKKYPLLTISATDPQSVSVLKERLYQDIVAQTEDVDLDFLCNVRQIQCLTQTLNVVQKLQKNLQKGCPDDILSLDLKQIILQLGEVTGDAVTEEVLDGIFSRFCVGK